MNMKKKLLSIVFLTSPALVRAEGALCLGGHEEKGAVNVIYFHGKGAAPLDEDSGERRDVKRIAERLGLRVAMVESPDLDGEGQRVWKRDDLENMRKVFRETVKKSEGCFPEGESATALLAFSSGGYFVNKLFQAGDLADYEWVMSLGAGGERAEPIEDPAKAGRLVVWFGAEEPSYYFDAAAAYAARLKEQGYDVDFQPFEGGHVLPSELIVLP